MNYIAIIGGRDFEDQEYFDLVTDKMIKLNNYDVIEIVSGGCPTGVDKMAKVLAKSKPHTLEYKEFEAYWKTYGKSAGPRRNRLIAEYANVMIAFWDLKSKGTKNSISTMLRLGKPVYIYPY